VGSQTYFDCTYSFPRSLRRLFFNSHGGGWSPSWVHAACRPILSAPGDYDNGEFGWIKIGRGNRSIRRKPAPAPICPPQIPVDQTRVWTWAATVGSQRLTAWAMARPLSVRLFYIAECVSVFFQKLYPHFFIRFIFESVKNTRKCNCRNTRGLLFWNSPRISKPRKTETYWMNTGHCGGKGNNMTESQRWGEWMKLLLRVCTLLPLRISRRHSPICRLMIPN
jgi:hypothetical protein